MLDIQDLKTCCHQNLFFHVDSGEAITISGSSGCGKSVLLRAICDLDPHEGEITLDGQLQDQLTGPEWRQRVGLLPAEYHFWTETVASCFTEPQIDERLEDSLEQLKLEKEIIYRPVNQLSAGEKQRLAFLRLMQNQPRCLLLDEACSHLDDDTTLALENIVKHYQTQTDAIVVWVSHDTRQRERVASRHLSLSSKELSDITL